MNPSRICFFAIFSKDFRKLRSSDVLAILLIAYGHILPKLFEFFKLNIEIAQNIFDCFWDIAENMGVLAEKLLKIWRQLQGANISTYYTMNTENLMPYDFVAANHKVILDLFKNSASVDQISQEIHKHYMVVPETLSQKEQQRGKE